MAELLTGALPQAANKLDQEWDEEQVYELGDLCPSENEKKIDSGNKLTRKPEKLPVNMESMHPDIEFRQSNRSADFIKGLSEEESDDRFINHGQLLHTYFLPLRPRMT